MCLAVPGRLVEIVDPATQVGTVDVGGVRRRVSVALCPEARVDDWVLVHVGFALARIDEDEAQATLALIEQLDLGVEEP